MSRVVFKGKGEVSRVVFVAGAEDLSAACGQGRAREMLVSIV